MSHRVRPSGKDGYWWELEGRELTLQINDITHRLAELKLRGGMDRDVIRSQIAALKAEQKVIMAWADHDINRLQIRLALNQELTQGLTSLLPEEQPHKKHNPH